MIGFCSTIEINDKYTKTLRNKFDVLLEISETFTLNVDYVNFVNAHMEAATDCILTKLNAKHRVFWETLEFKEKKKLWQRENAIPMQ